MASTKEIISPVLGQIKLEIQETETAITDIKTWLQNHEAHYNACRYSAKINFVIKYNQVLEDLNGLQDELKILKLELKNITEEYSFKKHEIEAIEAKPAKPEKDVNYTDELLKAGENIRQYVTSEWR